ncbi:hypothetical protein [Mycolicibacterium sp. HK-90]|uniref:hypothetical protein n=1 Tax=Mycolicibacterium sp. HK-90 TaxID=3056937 RepID=UPI00265B620C|nr:hypothetical protein [Mycolicibacterium sp. HK-90]WKG05937.1 hypothetical protein QU592_13015 [Mycolicibacterium sp. HK-90]
MADAEATKSVYVVDRILTKPGKARVFIDRYLAEYAPGARERGMTLEHVLVSPPIWLDDATNIVTVTWSLPSPLAWWQMTWKGRPDPALGQWWSEIGYLVLERSRSVAAAADDIDALCAFGEDENV